MQTLERPTFPDEASEEIYQYIERHGTVARHALRTVVSLDPEEFQTGLERLKERGYVRESGGTLELGLDIGAVEEHSTDGFTYTVRPARQDDFEGLVGTIRDVTDERTYVVAEGIAEQLLYEDTVTRHNSVESRLFFMATVEGDVVGWCHLDLPNVDKLQGTAQLTVGVRGDYRDNGIGSTLLERGIEWARVNGYRKVYNAVPAVNEGALVFLEDHGWETEGIRRDHYVIDGEPVDEVQMAYTL